jgi:sulfite reductase (ferredoxin)
VGFRCPATQVPDAIERLLRQYLAERDGENLRQWFLRHTNEELHSFLSGGSLEIVERDKPAGRVPHAVAD